MDRCKKLFAPQRAWLATIACVVVVASVPCAAATTSTGQVAEFNSSSETVRASVPSGARGEIVKHAAMLLADAIRHGGDEAAEVLKHLDKGAAKAFRKHSGTIANALDKIALIPDLTTQIVKEKLLSFLRNVLKLQGGTALQIADAVKAALDWML
ncbi:hypothetical protein [Haliangium sp.]|uniref:hypothetical protein n=1 Tax=Haliangium sp. TaxID=2663208 RepID=UPI003D0AC9CF